MHQIDRNVLAMNTLKTNIKQDFTVSDLHARPMFVTWREEERDGHLTKVPKNPATGQNASSSKPSTWSSYAAAERLAKKLQNGTALAGIGIMFDAIGDGWCLVGFDLDGCRDPESGRIESWAKAVIRHMASYTDVSPSGTGVHVYCLAREEDIATLIEEGQLSEKGSKEFSMGDHVGPAFYGGARYFTLSGQKIGEEDRLMPVSIAQLRWFLEVLGPGCIEESEGKAKRTKWGKKSGTRDESGSGFGFRFFVEQARSGKSAEEAIAAIESNDLPDEWWSAAEWWGRCGTRQQTRTVERAFKKVEKEEKEKLALLDDEPEDWTKSDSFRAIAELIGLEYAQQLADTTILSDGYSLDEDGVIRAFTDKHEGELVYDHHAASWFRFQGHRWQREETQLAKHYARKLSTALARRDPKVKTLKKVAAWEAVERGARTVRAFAVGASVWDRDPFLLGTPGGVVDLKTGHLRPGRPSDFISKSTAAAPIPLKDFDPQEHCPVWMQFLHEALGGDVDAIRFFQRWCGYCLSGDTSEQVLVFIYGPGGSGKTTAIETLAALLADYAIAVATSTLTKSKHTAHKEELARMDGARLAYASETEKGTAWAENRIKAVTGGDKITANYMRQNSFEFVPQLKLMIVGNNQPSLSDVDSAIRRRFHILPFSHQPKNKDKKLPKKLREEFPGILTWAIQGAIDLQKNGLKTPTVVERATREYFDNQDTFGQWLSDKCEEGPSYQETFDALWKSWLNFAHDNGNDPGTRQGTFPETLKQRGFKSKEKVGPKRARGYKGIRLKTHSDHEDHDLI